MTAVELAKLVTEGSQLNTELGAVKAKSERLDEIKELLRKEAAGADRSFDGEKGETVTVTHPRDGIARFIRGELLERVLKLAGRRKWKFFQLSPIPAKELPHKDFRVEVLQAMPKPEAQKLLAALTVPATARVTFA